MRIARFLAAAGIDSRRKCEQILSERRVKVNGRVVADPACNVDPEKDQIQFDEKVLRLSRPCYLLLCKPAGVTCSRSDQHAERLIGTLLPAQFGRLFTVGRLDRDSEGLILCTNDGKFAQKIGHPKYELDKIYQVTVRGKVNARTLNNLNRGIVSRGEKLAPKQVRNLPSHRQHRQNTDLEFVLQEGKNREIRRLCAHFNLPILSLRRIAIGSIRDPGLSPGEWRHLTSKEISELIE